MSKNLINDIVFDLGGVLVDWNPRNLFIGHRQERPEAVEHFLDSICTTRWHLGLDRGRRFSDATGELMSQAPQFSEWIAAYSDDWEEMFAGEIGHMVNLLRELSSRGYRTHALSNYPGEKLEFLYRRYSFMQTFDTVVASGLLGIVKPDSAIYDYLLARIGGGPCLFIDDRLENVEAARERGMHAIQYQPLGDPERFAQQVFEILD